VKQGAKSWRELMIASYATLNPLDVLRAALRTADNPEPPADFLDVLQALFVSGELCCHLSRWLFRRDAVKVVQNGAAEMTDDEPEYCFEYPLGRWCHENRLNLDRFLCRVNNHVHNSTPDLLFP